jgi:hypothetical protein
MTTEVDTLGGLSWVVAGLGTLSMHTPLKQHANQTVGRRSPANKQSPRPLRRACQPATPTPVVASPKDSSPLPKEAKRLGA